MSEGNTKTIKISKTLFFLNGWKEEREREGKKEIENIEIETTKRKD